MAKPLYSFPIQCIKILQSDVQARWGKLDINNRNWVLSNLFESPFLKLVKKE